MDRFKSELEGKIKRQAQEKVLSRLKLSKLEAMNTVHDPNGLDAEEYRRRMKVLKGIQMERTRNRRLESAQSYGLPLEGERSFKSSLLLRAKKLPSILRSTDGHADKQKGVGALGGKGISPQ